MDEIEIGTTVVLVHGAEVPAPDLVVVLVEPHPLPLEGGGLLPSHLYGLQWPDGAVTWHHRNEFERVLDQQAAMDAYADALDRWRDGQVEEPVQTGADESD